MKGTIYKRFLRNLVLFLVVLTVIYVILFSLQFGPYIPTEYWVRDAYIVKQHFAQSIKEKKILIISGSNGLFGIDSSLMENITGVKTVNMSVHAGLSLEYMLDPGKLFLHAGDIVVLTLEFEYFRQEKSFNDLTIEAIIAWDRRYYENLSLWRKIEFISSCSPLRVAAALFKKYVRRERRDIRRAADILASAKKLRADNNKKHSRSLYLNINRFGDIMGNKGTLKNLKAKAYGINYNGWEITSHSKKSLAFFVNYCRERGIKVFFTWPSMLKSKGFDLNSKTIRGNLAEINAFFDELDVPVLGEPEDFYFERKFFYDTSYHLNWQGREVRTRRLIGYLLSSLLRVPSRS